MALDDNILGLGVYSPTQAARLIGGRRSDVIRWTRGDKLHEPLFKNHFRFIENSTELSFVDLVEVRVVSAMRKFGISLQSIRFAVEFARDQLGVARPLATRSFKMEGTELLMNALEEDGELISLRRRNAGQKVFAKIVAQSVSDLEYEGGVASRWRPKGFSNVVLDPQRSFGTPILDREGISTSVLYAELKEFKDADYLSRIYEISKHKFMEAIRYEQSLDQ